MSRQVAIRLDYNRKVLVSMAGAERIASILDGCRVVRNEWTSDESFVVEESERFVTPMEFVTDRIITAREFEIMKNGAEES